MTYEQHYGAPAESDPTYAEVTHVDLIDQYYETEGDPAIGRELALRLFAHAQLSGDPRVTPLIGGDGAQVWHDGEPLMQSDYVNFAAKHHFPALGSILDFLMMRPGDPDYETVRNTMQQRLSPGY